MRPTIFIVILVIIFSVHVYASNDPAIIKASLKSVTVYRSGAEMNHAATAILRQGNNEVVIDNLSNAIDLNSIEIKMPSGVTVLGIQFSNNYLIDENNPAHLQLLMDSLDRVRQVIQYIDADLSNTNELIDVLKSNKNIRGEQSGVSVSELTKLMDYYELKLSELQKDLLQFSIRRKKENELAAKLEGQIAEDQKKNVSTAGRLTLSLSAAIAVKADFTVSYIAKNAYWVPFYDIRIDEINSPLKLVYKAKIEQTTGIDWKQVKLSLSTSTPSLPGSAPVLQSWFLGFTDPGTLGRTSLTGSVPGVQIRGNASLEDIVVSGYAPLDGQSENQYTAVKPVYVVNGKVMTEEAFRHIDPNTIKKMERLKPNAATAMYGSIAAAGATVVELKEGLEDYVEVTDKTLNVTFNIDTPFDVPTSGKEQTATLQSTDVKTFYQHYSVPRLDEEAYLIAEVPDWESLNLMAGEASISFEGSYVGKTVIDPKATADTLNLTVGHDKRVVIDRQKLVDFSSVRFLGNSKIEKFGYEITVKNNKSEPVHVLLKDQVPVSTNKEIEVELVDDGGALFAKEQGFLTWKLDVKAGEVKKVRFAYTIKYPKDKQVSER